MSFYKYSSILTLTRMKFVVVLFTLNKQLRTQNNGFKFKLNFVIKNGI